MAQELEDIDVDEVSPVRSGAIRKVWNILKGDDGQVELAKALVDALAEPFDDEGALVDALRKSSLSDDAQEAVVASMRLLKGFEGELPEALATKVAEILKQATDIPDADDPDDIAKSAEVAKRGFSTDQRHAMASNGEALPDGSFPIANRSDLENAVRAIGRASDVSKAKQHIVSRARSLDALDALPDDWDVQKSEHDDKEHAMGDAPPVPVRKEDGTWDFSGVDEAQRTFYQTVLKSLDDAQAQNTELAERVEKAEGRNADLEGKLLEKDLVHKAETDLKHVAPADETVAVLKAAKETMSAEQYEALETLLSKANAKIETGSLFEELGRSQDPVIKDAIRRGANLDTGSGGDAWAKIEELAKSLVEKSDDGDPISKEQAIARVLKTEEGAQLYGEYITETRGGAQ